MLAAVAVLAAAGIWLFRGQPAPPAAPAQAIPSPVSVPTSTVQLEPHVHGSLTTWNVPGPFVGLRSVAAAPDGRVWVTEQDGAQVDVLDGDTMTRYEISKRFNEAGAFAFGRGPDDALWFTGYPAGTLGRVLPDGRVNLFAPRGDGATTLAIAEGPGGEMWTTDPNLGAVVRIGSDGTVTPVLVSADGGQTQRPGFITQGTDGAMWFTIPDTSQVARLQPTGDPKITRYTVPGHVTPRNIVVGEDGDLWVSLEDRAALARVDEATGNVSIVVLRGGVPTRGLNDLAVAPDDTLWITTPSSAVLHVAPSGRVISRTDIPGTHYADGISVAPDGSVWVAARDDIIANIQP